MISAGGASTDVVSFGGGTGPGGASKPKASLSLGDPRKGLRSEAAVFG